MCYFLKKTTKQNYVKQTILTFKQMKKIAFFLLLLLFFACQKVATTWLPSEAKTAFRLNDLCFVNDSIGYVAGGAKFSDDILLKTHDGGKTWDTCISALSGKSFYALLFRTPQQGLVAGTDGRLYSTEDGGKSWQVKQMDYWKTLYAFDYVNDTDIIAVGGDGYNTGIIWKYTAADRKWALIDSPQFQLRDVDFVENGIGYACGYATIIKSKDGGLTWEITPAQNELFSALCFLNEKVGYAVGRTGSIIKTTDGGDSWETLRSGNSPFHAAIRLNDVAFVSEKTGYVVGDEGVVMKTTDAGKIWKTLQQYGKTDFQAIHLWNENKGIIVGSEGTIVNFAE